jgi:peptidoglycan hydrolase-like protein with peptidoglycan-binding domain
MRYLRTPVMLSSFFLGTVSYAAGGTDAERVIDTMRTSRNMDSTPPESILPSSPAIAGQPNSSDVATVLRAKAVLTRLGYDVGRFDEIKSAKLKAAVYRFQKARGLESNGDLDRATLAFMGIERR